MSEENEISAARLDVIHPASIAFADAVNNETYQLHKRSQKYNVKMAARIAELAKGMETIMNLYDIKGSDPLSILSFLQQLKKARYSNGISKSVAMWLLFFFMTKFPAILLSIRMTPKKDSGDYLDRCRVAKEQERTKEYVEAVHYLLKLYATDVVNARAAAEIETLERRP